MRRESERQQPAEVSQLEIVCRSAVFRVVEVQVAAEFHEVLDEQPESSQHEPRLPALHVFWKSELEGEIERGAI